jgi:hypothetical protein
VDYPATVWVNGIVVAMQYGDIGLIRVANDAQEFLTQAEQALT